MCHIANLQFIVAGAIFILAAWRCRSKDFQSIGSRLRDWCHGFDLPCFDFWTRSALSLLHAWGSVSTLSWEHTGALLNFGEELSLEDLPIQHKHPAGPETVPIKRTFFLKNVILPQCRADLMIGNPGKTWGAFFGFSASSLQRMHRYQLAVSILANASPLHYCKY